MDYIPPKTDFFFAFPPEIKKGQQEILSRPVSVQARLHEDDRQRYVLYNCCI